MTILLTARLRLRPLAPTDAPAIQALLALPEVRRFLCDDRVMPLTWVVEQIAASSDRFASDGAGLWAPCRHGDDQPIGLAGFLWLGEPPAPELVYALRPEVWGAGLAAEAVAAVIAHALGPLGWSTVEATTDAPNHASIRLLKRLGFARLPPRADDHLARFRLA